MNPDADSLGEPSREELIALIRAQAAEIAALKARIAELERRLGLNSSNSGKPPSSDGLKKPPRVSSLREPSDKPSGGQKGHQGETLRQVTEPDRIVDHYPPSCTACGAPVTPAMSAGHSARQVFDLPEPAALVVTEHRAHDCRCSGCGARSRALFPNGIKAPVQYGPRIAAFVTYLLHYQLLPEDRLAELMADLFGVKLAAATIARMSRTCAARWQDFITTVRDLVAGAPVKHMDETGFRIGGKTQWLHVASTAWLTFYRVCARRGSLLAKVVGIVVHDHWKPYYTMPNVLHALCNAHHLRELKALIDIEKEDWARNMQHLLRRACNAANSPQSAHFEKTSASLSTRSSRACWHGLSGVMTPSSPKAWHSTRPNRRSRPPPAKEILNLVVASRAEPATIFSCASPPASKTSCASSKIQPCPSPTIRPNVMCV